MESDVPFAVVTPVVNCCARVAEYVTIDDNSGVD
jgi:hypothetical protein